MRRLLTFVVFVATLATACGGGAAPVADRDTSSTNDSSPSAAAAPAETDDPAETAAPASEEPTLSASDRKYLRGLGKLGRSEFLSEQDAIEAGQELCDTIQRADKDKGSVNVKLSPSWTELVVGGLKVSFEVYIAALKEFCPEFDFLIEEMPGG